LIPDIKYSNTSLDSLITNVGIQQFLPKPEIIVFSEILEIFKYICNKTNYELCINLYYDTLKDNFKLNIPDQIVSVASIKYNYNEDIELSDRYIRYLQIHSHNTMPAFFSKTDNADEAFTNLCYYGVVGKISKESTFYNIDMIFRIWNGINFVNVDLNNVFDINFASYKLSQNQIQKLNKVIETSKKISRKLTKIFLSIIVWSISFLTTLRLMIVIFSK